jgi:hypothetical protein
MSAEQPEFIVEGNQRTKLTMRNGIVVIINRYQPGPGQSVGRGIGTQLQRIKGAELRALGV